MAKKEKGGLKIRTVKTKEDRKRPSVFMRLKADESFKGIALFEPDPELDGNPGYYEYYDHFDKQANQYVPCAGENCPFCAANDNPSTRALTVWYFPEAADAKDQIKVFTMNYSTINDLTDEAEEEDGILGKKIRVKRLDDRGNYKVRVLSDKPLTKKEIEKLLKTLEGLFKDGLEGVVLTQLKKQIERLKAMDALDDDSDDDDDDDDEDEDEDKGKKKSSAKKGKEEDDDDDDDDDDDEDDDDDDDDEKKDDDDEDGISELKDAEVEILKASKKNNSITVEIEDEGELELIGDDDTSIEGFKKGMTVVVSAEYDEDEEAWTLTSIAEPGGDDDDDDDDASDDDDDEETLSGVEYEVVKVQEKDEIFDLKNDDGKVKMWLGEGVDVDYDEIKKGVKVKVDAAQDDEGDWIITEISLVKAKGGKKQSGGKKKK